VNPNENPLCGKTASVNYQGKNVQVSLTDRCAACAYGDLDFSPAAFDQLADPSVGRISGIQWSITN
jgi:expansin (peptidoglycan-binding protein)